MGKFEIKRGKNDQFHFNLKAGNGQVILTSEMYTTRASCDKGIASVRKNAPDDKRYERKQSKSGKFHFNLKAGNHQIIGSSQLYVDEYSMNAGIDSVKANAPEAKIVELD